MWHEDESRDETPEVLALPQEREEALRLAVHMLADGALVVLPTDTVYGLAARAFDRSAVEAAYMAKCRSVDKKLPLLIAEPEDLWLYGRDTKLCVDQLVRRFWPGALTVVVDAAHDLPPWLVDERDGVALRCPDHGFVRDVIRGLGEPIVATSANLAGGPEATTVGELPDELLESVDLVVDDGPGSVTPSTVVDCRGEEPVVLRDGTVDIAET